MFLQFRRQRYIKKTRNQNLLSKSKHKIYNTICWTIDLEDCEWVKTKNLFPIGHKSEVVFLLVNQRVIKFTSDNACKVWKKRIFVVTLHSISMKTIIILFCPPMRLCCILLGKNKSCSLIFNYFCSSHSERIFVTKVILELTTIDNIIDINCLIINPLTHYVILCSTHT